jgi:hypothetical protein
MTERDIEALVKALGVQAAILILAVSAILRRGATD